MLSPDYLEYIADEAGRIYNDLELDILESIARRIANVGYANTVVRNDVEILQQMGLLNTDIAKIIADSVGKSQEEILKIFEEAGTKTLNFDDSVYKEAGLNPLPINQSPQMLNVLKGMALNTEKNLRNLTKTIAKSSQENFLNGINKAYLETATGVKSYSQAIIDSINKIGDVYIEYPSGHRDTVEVASRRAVLTGVSQVCGRLQEQRAEEMGWDLMEITAHPGARPSHAEWQGKIVSLSGKKGYLSKKDIGYGDILGFKGINCKHEWFPFSKFSERSYTDAELEKYKNEKVTYNGKEYSRYEASQIQRGIERNIRKSKKEIASLKGIMKSNNASSELIDKAKQSLREKTNKLNKYNSQLNDFINQTNFTKDYSRTSIAKSRDIKPVDKSNDKEYNINEIPVKVIKQADDNTIKKYIKANKNYQKINHEKQGRHLKNSKLYIEGRSYFENETDESLEKYLQKYSGTGELQKRIKFGKKEWTNKEVVIIEELNGINVDQQNKYQKENTHRFTIHYSNTGAHIVPTNSKGEDRK